MVSSRRAEQIFTEEEYLGLEQVSRTKHEFFEGRIVSMAGASPAHNRLAMQLGALLLGLVRGRGCAVMGSDQRVHVTATGLYTYPDLTVACGERRYASHTPPSLLNPTLLVEVTSDSTEADDRGAKFVQYKSIPSLVEYLVVSHRAPRVDLHQRLETGQWLITTLEGHDAVLTSGVLGGALRLGDVYADVDLDEGRAVPAR